MKAPFTPAPDDRPARRSRRSPRSHPHRALALETSAKLAVNGVLCLIAIVALVRLLAHRDARQAELARLEGRVRETRARVDRLQGDFNRYFDPQQTKNIMQEQSDRVDPQRVPVIWSPEAGDR